MSHYEILQLILQAGTLGVLFLTLLWLRKYTHETKRLAEAAVEGMPRPCIEVLQEADQSEEGIVEGQAGSIVGTFVHFKNIGTALAVNTRYEVEGNTTGPYKV